MHRATHSDFTQGGMLVFCNSCGTYALPVWELSPEPARPVTPVYYTKFVPVESFQAPKAWRSLSPKILAR